MSIPTAIRAAFVNNDGAQPRAESVKANMRHAFATVLALGIGSSIAHSVGFLPGLALTFSPPPQLPDWYNDHRVQAHTRFALRMLAPNPPRYWSAPQKFKAQGVKVYTRWLKGRYEGAWWPSEVGEVEPEAKTVNIAKRIIDDSHAQGLKIIAYHMVQEDAGMAKAHPDWICLNGDGTPAVTARKQPFLSFNSPYADYVLARAKELVNLGVDGFYYDETHQPPGGDFSEFTKKAFRAATGKTAPNRAVETDPLYQEYLDFCTQTVARTFDKWAKELRAIRPDLVMIVSQGRWGAFGYRYMSPDVFQVADSVKTEYNVGLRRGNNLLQDKNASLAKFDLTSRMVLPWVIARDVIDGRPAHIWADNLPDERSVIAATSALLTTGCIANLDINEQEVPAAKFTKSFALGDKVSEVYAGSKPDRWFGVHYSMRARDAFKTRELEDWKNVLYPVYGAFSTAYRARIPVGIIFDDQLARGDLGTVKVLFLTNPDALTANMKQQVSRFQSRGGVVISNKPNWTWWSAGKADDASRSLLEEIQKTPREAQVFGGPSNLMTGFFTKGDHLIVSIAGDSSWVETSNENGIDPSERARRGTAYRAADGVTVRVTGAAPTRVTERVTGQTLTAKPTSGGFEIAVPTFTGLSLLDIER